MLEFADVEHALLHVHERGQKGDRAVPGGLQDVAVGCIGEGRAVDGHKSVANREKDEGARGGDGGSVAAVKGAAGKKHLVAPHVPVLAHLEDRRRFPVSLVAAEQPGFFVVQIEEILGHESLVQSGDLEAAGGPAVERLAGCAHTLALDEHAEGNGGGNGAHAGGGFRNGARRNGFLHEMPPVQDRAAWLVVPAAIRLSPLSAMGFRGGTVNIACYGRESNLKPGRRTAVLLHCEVAALLQKCCTWPSAGCGFCSCPYLPMTPSCVIAREK